MSRNAHTLGHVMAYHGCDAELGERVLAGKETLHPSTKDYDWLGNGIYFWVDSPKRAWDWAVARQQQGKIETPFVLGALVYPGLCLNLTDYGVIDELAAAYKVLATVNPLPKNSRQENGTSLIRRLDCAVIQTLHALREQSDLPCYDTAYGVFEEGNEAYPGAGFKQKTHVQLAVRNPNSIVAYFRVQSP